MVESIAVRAMRVPTDSEWEMISASSQQGIPERDEGRQEGLLGLPQGELPGRQRGEGIPGLQTEGELPGRQTGNYLKVKKERKTPTGKGNGVVSTGMVNDGKVNNRKTSSNGRVHRESGGTDGQPWQEEIPVLLRVSTVQQSSSSGGQPSTKDTFDGQKDRGDWRGHQHGDASRIYVLEYAKEIGLRQCVGYVDVGVRWSFGVKKTSSLSEEAK